MTICRKAFDGFDNVLVYVSEFADSVSNACFLKVPYRTATAITTIVCIGPVTHLRQMMAAIHANVSTPCSPVQKKAALTSL